MNEIKKTDKLESQLKLLKENNKEIEYMLTHPEETRRREILIYLNEIVDETLETGRSYCNCFNVPQTINGTSVYPIANEIFSRTSDSDNLPFICKQIFRYVITEEGLKKLDKELKKLDMGGL